MDPKIYKIQKTMFTSKLWQGTSSISYTTDYVSSSSSHHLHSVIMTFCPLLWPIPCYFGIYLDKKIPGRCILCCSYCRILWQNVIGINMFAGQYENVESIILTSISWVPLMSSMQWSCVYDIRVHTYLWPWSLHVFHVFKTIKRHV